MKKILTLISLLKISACCFAMISRSFTKMAEWRIAEGYHIRFDGKYAHGSFQKMGGNIRFDPVHPSDSHFEVDVDVASIDTGIDLKNKHAKSEKWFDAAQYPRIHFTSRSVSATDTGFVVRGELEMRGIAKEISIPFAFSDAGSQKRFYGKFRVNRGDFGIGKVGGKESDSTAVEVSVPVY